MENYLSGSWEEALSKLEEVKQIISIDGPTKALMNFIKSNN
jgi:hypothetical protein